MALVYDDSEGSVGGVSNKSGLAMRLDRMNPNKPWATHASNWYYLKFVYAKGNILEKRAAQKELLICERKMAFWERHPGWSIEESGKVLSKLQSEWKSAERPLHKK